MPARNFTDSEEEQIAKIYLSGISARAIARAYNLGHHISITSALRRQQITQRSPAERNRLYKVNPYAFDEIDNELTAYWWGFLYADGFTHNRTLHLRLAIKDIEQVRRLKRFLELEAPIKVIYVGASNTPKKYKQAIIETTDKHLVGRLGNLGIIRNRPIFSKAIRFLPIPLTHHWIRGYFDGDGSARQDKSLSFVGQPELLKWLRLQFATYANTNPKLAITKHITANIHYLTISGRIQALKVADYIYQDATIWMERKRNVIDNWPKPKQRYRNKKGQFT